MKNKIKISKLLACVAAAVFPKERTGSARGSQQHAITSVTAPVTDMPAALNRPIPEIFQPCWGASDLDRRQRAISALQEQGRVIGSLILREVRTRFGRQKLGYLWALLEPALHIGVFWTLYYVGGRHAVGTMPIPLFLATGLMPYFAFSQTYSRLTGAIRTNFALLAHRQVKPLDVILARALLEGATVICVLLLFAAGAAFFGIDVKLHDPLGAIAAFGLLWMLGLGLGLLVEAVSTLIESLRMVMSVAIRFLYFTSGIFFTVSMMQGDLRSSVLTNPVLHLVETVRYSFDPVLTVSEVNLYYPAVVSFSVLFLGMAADRALRDRLLTQ